MAELLAIAAECRESTEGIFHSIIAMRNLYTRSAVSLELQCSRMPAVASWQGANRAGGQLPLPKFWAARKFSSSPKIFVQNAKFGMKNPIWGKFRSKIGILSTLNLLCQKFSAVSRSANCNFLCPETIFC